MRSRTCGSPSVAAGRPRARLDAGRCSMPCTSDSRRTWPCRASAASTPTPKTEIYRTFCLIPENDIAQVHRYLDLGARLEVCHGPVDILAADAVQTLLSFNSGKPVVLAESGAVEPSHSGPFKLYDQDKEGILLHDILFAPFFTGAAGAGQCWHWDSYVAKNDLVVAVPRICPGREGHRPARRAVSPDPHRASASAHLRAGRTAHAHRLVPRQSEHLEDRAGRGARLPNS